MKRRLYCLVVIGLLLAIAGCAATDRGNASLQEWRRSYLPTRNG